MPAFLSLLLTLLFPVLVLAEEPFPEDLREVGIVERIGDAAPSQTVLYNASGNAVVLADYLEQDRVILLNFVYYNCPMLCSLFLDGFRDGVAELSASLDTRFTVLSISMDPRDTTENAAAYAEKYRGSLSENRQVNWEFFTGSEAEVKTLADAVGFRYKFLPDSGEYAHSAGVIFLTADGKVARYLYGIQYSPFDLKLGILESAKKRFVSSIEQGLLFCYTYDPEARSYVVHATRLMQVAGLVTIIMLVSYFFWLNYQRKRSENGR